jgi:hypothetical protein
MHVYFFPYMFRCHESFSQHVALLPSDRTEVIESLEVLICIGLIFSLSASDRGCWKKKLLTVWTRHKSYFTIVASSSWRAPGDFPQGNSSGTPERLTPDAA